MFGDIRGDYLDEVYDDAADLDSGVDVVVTAETTVTGIDAALAVASKISGTVTGPDGTTSLSNIQATVYCWNEFNGLGYWRQVSSVLTDADGNYRIGGLTTGTYRMGFADWSGVYVAEAYDNAADLYNGKDIDMAAGETVTGIDASLAVAGMISGMVTGPDGGAPLKGIRVTAYRRNESGPYWELVARGIETDAAGAYTIGGLAVGSYRVEFSDDNGDYMAEVYDDAVDLDSGADVVVTEGETIGGIDASLAIASKISGTVTGPDGTTPLEGIQATAFGWNESWGVVLPQMTMTPKGR